jgi:predicted CxxxxCH...CXXCH cytochrome family protein
VTRGRRERGTRSRGALVLGCVSLLLCCSQERASTQAPPVFDVDVAPILQASCVTCHGTTSPAAGWSATSYLSTIACVEPSGAPATLPPSTAPILTALGLAPHVGLVSGGDQSTLEAWVSAGAPAFAGTVHPPGIVDPRSSAFHGTLLRSQRWAQMLDPANPNACGQCHDGTPGPVPGVTFFAPGATACNTCHSEPLGPLECNTCHGSGARIYPPRDLCFFPGDASTAGAHAAHVQPSQESASGVACQTCHPTPTPGPTEMTGLHGNGTVDVTFDTAVVTSEASYDQATGACAVSCHDLGGQDPRPRWSDTTVLGCNSCHLSPPLNHYPGPCNDCHGDTNATGTALTGSLHMSMSGQVVLGNGSGLCGACHGTGASPWPTTAAHPGHENPTISLGVACASCHPVPTSITDPTHLDGIVQVTFTGLAVARGALPVWNGASCASVACHGANLADPAAVPVWTDPSGEAAKCGACHGIPPSQHTASTSCNRSDCHGSEVTLDGQGVPSITSSGETIHVNGVINFN